MHVTAVFLVFVEIRLLFLKNVQQKTGKKIQVFIFYIQTNISLKIVLMVKRCIFGDFGVKDHSNISHHLTVHIMVVTGSG